MEQRIAPITQPMQTAGTDPAYIPGITAPRPEEAGEAGEAEHMESAAETASQSTAEPLSPDAATDDDAPEEAVAKASVTEEPVAEEPVAKEPVAKAEESSEAAEVDADGPVFEVSDHRGSITADRTGITFRLDGETAEFGWDEIGAVEVETPRFSRLFTVTVYTTSRRWYEAYVQVSARNLLKEWTVELDAVLDACFEDSEH